MRYDSTYTATVATVIPLVFVAIVIDLGLAKKSATPLAAGILLSLVIVLLAAELLCLNALSDKRELRQGEGILVAGAVLFSGTTVLYRLGEPLLKTSLSTRLASQWSVPLSPDSLCWRSYIQLDLSAGVRQLSSSLCALWFWA